MYFQAPVLLKRGLLRSTDTGFSELLGQLSPSINLLPQNIIRLTYLTISRGISHRVPLASG